MCAGVEVREASQKGQGATPPPTRPAPLPPLGTRYVGWQDRKIWNSGAEGAGDWEKDGADGV